jgi:hypothetical protein
MRAKQFGIEERSRVVELDEPVSTDVGRVGHDPIDVPCCQGPTVEEQRHHLGEVAVSWFPVHHEQPAKLDVESDLLQDLTLYGPPRRLIDFHDATRNVPGDLVKAGRAREDDLPLR